MRKLIFAAAFSLCLLQLVFSWFVAAPRTTFDAGMLVRLLQIDTAPAALIDSSPPQGCEYLAQLSREQRQEPNNFRSLTDLARGYATAINAGISCPNPVINRETTMALLRQAETLAPSSGERMLASAEVLLQLNVRFEAFRLLRRAQEDDLLFPAAIERRLVALPLSKEELRQILPRRLPQALHWIGIFQNERPDEYGIWADAFAQALAPAVAATLAEAEAQRLKPQAAQKYLRDVFVSDLLTFDDRLRRQLDATLATAFGDKEVAQFLTQRSRLTRQSVLFGALSEDFTPEETPLQFVMANFSGKQLRLDRAGQSIGIKRSSASDNQANPVSSSPVSLHSVRLLVLQSANSSPPLTAESLQILVSTDNSSYVPVSAQLLLSALIHDRHFIVFTFAEEVTAPYLKLHYRGFNEQSEFSNSARTLLQLYIEPSVAEAAGVGDGQSPALETSTETNNEL